MHVTEHAILRYLERVDGIDIAAVKGKILTEKTVVQINTLGDGRYPVVGKHFAVVKNKTVVTIT